MYRRSDIRPYTRERFTVAGSQEAEAFAEMMETQLFNPVGWKLIERHFPASVKMFKVITKDAMKQ